MNDDFLNRPRSRITYVVIGKTKITRKLAGGIKKKSFVILTKITQDLEKTNEMNSLSRENGGNAYEQITHVTILVSQIERVPPSGHRQ